MYLTQLALLSLLVASQTTSMSRRHDDVQGQLDMEQFDCVSTGEKWRAYKTDALKILAGKCDSSGSSLADHMLGIDIRLPDTTQQHLGLNRTIFTPFFTLGPRSLQPSTACTPCPTAPYPLQHFYSLHNHFFAYATVGVFDEEMVREVHFAVFGPF